MKAGQHVVVYGPAAAPRVYDTVYTHEQLVLACGYARLAHPGEDVRAIDCYHASLVSATT